MPENAVSKTEFKISVRDLVEHVLRGGDLRFDFMSSMSAVAGIRAHQRLQAQRPAGYQAEVAVNLVLEYSDFALVIGGRMDGVLREEDRTIIEEIKTTQRPLEEVEAAPSVVHWGQAQCYAYMYALEEKLSQVEVRLTYIHLESSRILELERSLSMDQLTVFFNDLVARYLQWIEWLSQWNRLRDQSIERLAFPFEHYRPGQRELAVEVFRTIRDGQQILVQAATGIGKTMAILYPAIKALGQGLTPKVIFLTARTTGRLAAEAALAALGRKGMRLKWVTLTAKEKICFSPGSACTPDECPFAKGYFDRLNSALAALFENDALNREVIERIAREHQVCPFEFSLEAVSWADGVICDYNYAFDPNVMLKRLFGEEAEHHAVLVDEAHNLVDRARDMYSAQLAKQPIQALRQKLKAQMPGLYRKLGPVHTWMAALRKRCLEAGAALIEKEVPEDLVEKLRAFLMAAELWLRQNLRTEFREDLVQFYFDGLRFIKVSEQFGPHYVVIAEADGKDARIKLFCMDPSQHLAACWQNCRAAVLFSATLTPAQYFRSILGCHADARRLDLASPFSPANLGVFAALRISTLYRQRQTSCQAVSEAIGRVVSQRLGNYLLFFPSYEYMALVHEQFIQEHGDIQVLMQTPEMSEADREEFLGHFREEITHTVAGFVVMGGIFGEGIDLRGERLSGAVVVGVGLPGIGPERELIREYYDRQFQCGFEFAYQYPGINRVLQAAGRVIRSETDRGVLLLIDQRYGQYRYRSLLPAEWRMLPMRDKAEFQRQLAAFWNENTSPLLPVSGRNC
ncbi:MAG: DEAD/DEAH box helicase [Desulfobacteraceae bacterium]|nr:DEAD/DEAH box helicase [Desulfobacteraceae bacterium]